MMVVYIHIAEEVKTLMKIAIPLALTPVLLHLLQV